MYAVDRRCWPIIYPCEALILQGRQIVTSIGPKLCWQMRLTDIYLHYNIYASSRGSFRVRTRVTLVIRDIENNIYRRRSNLSSVSGGIYRRRSTTLLPNT